MMTQDVHLNIKSQDNRAIILERAKLLFRQQGYHAVSLNDIVAVAGVKKPTIYHYFRDKETLYTEVLIEMMRLGHQHFNRYLSKAGKPPLQELLTRLAEGYFNFSPTSLSTMFRDALQNLSEIHLKRVMDAHQFYILNPFMHIFEEATLNSEIRPQDSARELAMVFISINRCNDGI